MQTGYSRNYLTDSVRVQEYFRKREKVLNTLDAKLESGEASLDDFADAIRILRTDGALQRALFRQCGIAV